MTEQGGKPSKIPVKQVLVRVPLPELAKWEELAREEGKSVGMLVRLAMAARSGTEWIVEEVESERARAKAEHASKMHLARHRKPEVVEQEAEVGH